MTKDETSGAAAPIHAKPVPALLDAAAANFPQAIAMDFLGKRTSYAELTRLADAAAAGFQRLGVKKGSRVALCLPNTPYAVICYYAILKAGGIVVNLSPLYVEREFRHFIQDSGATIAVTLDLAELYNKLSPVIGSCGLETLIICSLPAILPPLKRLGFHLTKRKELANFQVDARHIPFRSLIAPGGRPMPVACDPEADLAVLQYTGGTTGIPKAAMLTHANLTANCEQVARLVPELQPASGSTLVLVPLFHVFAMTVAMNLSIRFALNMVLLPRYDKELLRHTLHRTKPIMFPGVPTIYATINEAAAKEPWDLSSIRYCLSGAAPLPAEVQHRFEQLSGCSLVEGYGLTEASPVVSANPFGHLREGSIGIPLPYTEVEIRSQTDPTILLPPGEKGEVCVRGPQVMRGYWNRPDETAKVFIDGALRTGDVGYIDADGYIFLVDRIKDVIISGGYNVYPRIIEEALYQHPAVAEAAVIGIPDARRGQVAKAFVKLREGHVLSEAELHAFLAGHLSPVERPKCIEFRDYLPKTAVGKLSKKELVAEAKANAA
jgi:long-chain acyl-CoA synthetase